jgi:hypothetical protein
MLVIFPDLDAKRDIVQNAIDLYTQIGLGTPRVALLSAVETVTKLTGSAIFRGCAPPRPTGRAWSITPLRRIRF